MWWLAPAIGAALGGAMNLFGGEEKKTYTIDDLIKYGYKPYNEQDEIQNLHRYSAGLKKQRTDSINQKLSSEGYSPVSNIYANEEDIIKGTMTGESDIRQKAQDERNKTASMLFRLNEGQEVDEGWLMKFLTGATGGASLGSNIGNLLKTVKY